MTIIHLNMAAYSWIFLWALLWPGLIPAAQEAEPAAATYKTESLGDGLYVFRFGTRQSIFLVGDDAVIATDPLNAAAARIYRDEIARITDKRVKYVAYTSSFFDRIAGGGAFDDDNAIFVAQENCAANLQATPHPDIVDPDITYTDTYEITAGNVSLELHYFGQSYGTCLSVMIAQPANIMLVMNLVNPPAARVPEDPTLANYYLHNLVPFFESVEALAAERGVELVVGAFAIGPEPGDQPAISSTPGLSTMGPATLIGEQRVFWETLFDIVETEYDKGTPARMIPKRADMRPLAGYAGYSPRRVEIMMRRIYSLYRIGR